MLSSNQRGGRWTLALLAWASIALPNARSQTGAGASPEIAAIRLHLVYEETGRLSEDIAPPAEFVTWNTVIGEGDAAETANDALAFVEVRTPGHANVDVPLTIEARGKNNKLLARRTVRGLLTSDKGRSFQSLWIPNVGCADKVTVTARMGGQQKRIAKDFPCGE